MLEFVNTLENFMLPCNVYVTLPNKEKHHM